MEMTLRLAPHCIVKRSQVLALSSSDVFQVLLQAPVRSSTGAAFKHLANAWSTTDDCLESLPQPLRWVLLLLLQVRKLSTQIVPL